MSYIFSKSWLCSNHIYIYAYCLYINNVCICTLYIHTSFGLIYKSENISGKPFRNAHVTGSSESRICAYIVHIIILQQPGIFRINVLGAIPADSAMRNSCVRRPCTSTTREGSSPPRCLCRDQDV